MKAVKVLILSLLAALLTLTVMAETEDSMTDKPHVTGTFLQPNAFTSFTREDWKRHMDYLTEAGMDTIIVQWIADTPYGKMTESFCPVGFDCEKAPGYRTYDEFLPTLLSVAQEKGIKVFVGLNMSDEWWEIACSMDDWNRMQADLGLRLAEGIYRDYKKQYPDALYGWYFAWEMFNGMYGQEDKASSFLNLYLDPLNELSPEMPILLSPFVRTVGGTPEQAEQEWKKVFAASHFREGDIFCCQDAVGAEHITIGELDGYFAALKNAVDTCKGLQFWANSECFRKVSEGVFATASVDRFLRQLEIAWPYVTGYVTFAYSHYYSPDVIGRDDEHRAYLDYLRK